MIFTPHLVIGAVIGSKTHNLGLIIILGILSHFILDKLPHWDYSNSGISNFRETKNFKALITDLIKIAIDGMVGVLIIVPLIWHTGLFSDFKNIVSILLGMFFSTLPDIFLFFGFILFSKKTMEKTMDFHVRFLHCKKEGYRITFLNLTTEIFVILLAILVFFS